MSRLPPPRKVLTMASLLVVSACCHCLSSTITTVRVPSLFLPVRMKSMRFEVFGTLNSMAIPVSSGISGSSTIASI